ncbi:MAG: PilZ domain-containing protein [Phycisphaerales bacterium]
MSSTRSAPLNPDRPLKIRDRRVADRTPVHRPCKLQRRAGSPFDQARTINLSTTGALIELRTSRTIPVAGEELAVAVAWTPSPLLKTGDLVPARVIRATPREPLTCEVAIEFLRARALAA